MVAAILACEFVDEGRRTFFAHKGTTFGGISIARATYSASAVDEMLRQIQTFLKEQGFEKVYLKMVPQIYQKENSDLLDYFLYKEGFHCYNELNYYLPLERYQEDILARFSSGKRRDYRYSLKNNFEFRRLDTKEEIAAYYEVLLMNLRKPGLNPVHSLEDLYDLRFNRFPEKIRFYGMYKEDEIVAGSMLFYLGKDIVHTHYLSSNKQYLNLYPMEILIGNLIRVGVEEGMRIFSFGICTEDQGRSLNLGLSRFKEGFGAEFCVNRSFEKLL